MQAARNSTRSKIMGFSLIELVIVVVIIGIIGAIAVPRMSRGAKGAADSALVANLAVIRNALDLYATEHGGDYPENANAQAALISYTQLSGGLPVATKAAPHIYGPYVRAIPKLPVGINKGESDFTHTDPALGATANFGWYYDRNNLTNVMVITANTADSETDEAGVAYNTY